MDSATATTCKGFLDAALSNLNSASNMLDGTPAQSAVQAAVAATNAAEAAFEPIFEAAGEPPQS